MFISIAGQQAFTDQVTLCNMILQWYYVGFCVVIYRLCKMHCSQVIYVRLRRGPCMEICLAKLLS